MSTGERWRTFLDFARPFTLIAPALGFFSAALTAIGARPAEVWHWRLIVPPCSAR